MRGSEGEGEGEERESGRRRGEGVREKEMRGSEEEGDKRE